MITTLLFDFSKVLLFVKDPGWTGKLNDLHAKFLGQPDYNFLDHFVFNDELFTYLDGLKDRYSLVIFTSGSIQEAEPAQVRLSKTFQKILTARDFGLKKIDPEVYKKVIETLGKKPEEIVFIDDKKENVEAAMRVGIKTIQFLSNEQLKKDLATLLT